MVTITLPVLFTALAVTGLPKRVIVKMCAITVCISYFSVVYFQTVEA